MDMTVTQPKAQPVKNPEVSSATCNTSVTTAGSSRRSEPRRTEADFRLPEDQAKRKVDECKQQ